MVLVPCPECKKQISDTSDSCPQCGYKLTPEKLAEIKKKEKQNLKVGSIGCLAILAILAILFVAMGSLDSTKTETRQEKIEKHFSSWDGSHYGLTKEIKKSMHDPKSYDHVKTTYRDNGDHLVVTTVFRGKNLFGGVIQNSVTAKVDLNGNVIEIIK